MKTSTKLDNAYFELVRRFPLRSLESEKDLDAAIEIVNELVDRGFDNLTSGEEAYLDVLSDLVEKYESWNHPIPDVKPAEMLQFLIEDRKTTQRAVAKGSGIAISTMSQLLSGQREMNVDHMKRLGAFFGIDTAVFLPRAAETPVPRRGPNAAAARYSRRDEPRRRISKQRKTVPAVRAASAKK